MIRFVIVLGENEMVIGEGSTADAAWACAREEAREGGFTIASAVLVSYDTETQEVDYTAKPVVLKRKT